MLYIYRACQKNPQSNVNLSPHKRGIISKEDCFLLCRSFVVVFFGFFFFVFFFFFFYHSGAIYANPRNVLEFS